MSRRPGIHPTIRLSLVLIFAAVCAAVIYGAPHS